MIVYDKDQFLDIVRTDMNKLWGVEKIAVEIRKINNILNQKANKGLLFSKAFTKSVNGRIEWEVKFTEAV